MTKVVIITGLQLEALASVQFKLKDILEGVDFIAGESLNTAKIKELLKSQNFDLEELIHFEAQQVSRLAPLLSELVSTDHLYRRIKHFFNRQGAIVAREVRADSNIFDYPIQFLQKHTLGSSYVETPVAKPVEPVAPVAPIEPPSESEPTVPVEPVEPTVPVEPIEPPPADAVEPPPAVEPETPEVTYVVPADVVYAQNAKTSFVNSGGNLVYGSGIQAGGLSVASDEIIELALGARVFGVKTPLTAEDNVYAVDLAADADWATVASVGLLNTTDSSDIVELYDVALHIGEYGYALTKVDAGYAWTALNEGEDSITDVALNKQATAVQTLVRQFQEATEGEEVVLNLTASHKASGKAISNAVTVKVVKAAVAE